MAGARLLGAVTVIANAGREAVARPSLTRMTIFEYVPTLAAVGVPLRSPVDAVNVAHVGRFVMLYVSLSPSGSEPVGLNE
jgi:hypothetical protein